MSPAFIKGVVDSLPNARVTFDKFHVVAHASTAVDETRRLEQRTDPSLKGLRWTLLKDRDRLSDQGRADLDALIAKAATKRTARAGSTASICAKSSTASRSTSSPPSSRNGAPMFCTPRSSR